ncbi:Spx/MgsR family RNA polymerase-binding regulatory protein [uncultured Sneathiella sp.]|uniref:Spx/MgsR family RNA polymerase-binding regulatory protein n=1 Tax=uncultured Sneathiella sp. TaxID=879315 RepID=UPI0030ECE270
MKIYGIKNCDTCKKAIKWLKDEGIDCQFHDLRADGLSEEELARWLAAIDSDILINKRGTTYRQLDDAAKAELGGANPAKQLLAAPTLLKRPIFAKDGQYLVGFKEPEKATLREWAV